MEKKKKYYLKHQDRINLIQMGAQTFFYSYMDLSLASHEEHPEICQKYEIRQTLGTQTLFSLFLLSHFTHFFFFPFSFHLPPRSFCYLVWECPGHPFHFHISQNCDSKLSITLPLQNGAGLNEIPPITSRFHFLPSLLLSFMTQSSPSLSPLPLSFLLPSFRTLLLSLSFFFPFLNCFL